jgi:hypothetical protein
MGIDDESSHPELCSEVAGGVTRTIVCLFREPDAGNLPVLFDEREQETEPSQTGLRRRRESFVSSHREAKATAPVLDSTCAVKGAGLQRVQLPPGNWFAPPGSNRSGSGGNEAVGAFDVEGR